MGKLSGLEPGFDGLSEVESRAVCRLRATFRDSAGKTIYRRGSGFLIHIDQTWSYVLTAAHNLFNHNIIQKSRRKAEAVKIWFGRSGNSSWATRNGTAISIRKGFTNASVPLPHHDFALVQTTALGADRFRSIPLTITSSGTDEEALIIGYPNIAEEIPHHVSDVKTQSKGASNLNYIRQRTYAGMSGGPLLITAANGNGWEGYGVHIGDTGHFGGKRAVRISDSIFRSISGWIQ